MMGLIRVCVELGTCKIEGRLGGSSLRRPLPFMVSLVARDGLLDRLRREREISTWLSDGEGVGDLEVVLAGADRAVVTGRQVSISMSL